MTFRDKTQPVVSCWVSDEIYTMKKKERYHFVLKLKPLLELSKQLDYKC